MSEMGAWVARPLEDIVTTVIDYRGKTPPGHPSGIPTFSAKNVKNGRLVGTGERFVSLETYERWATRGFIAPNDLLFTTEAPVAQVALLPGDQTYLMTRRVIALRIDETKADPRFLKYSFMSGPNRRRLENLSHGTTVPRLYKEDILGCPVLMPEAHHQRKIVAVLAAYDELIENNLRRIEILEEMAQAVYREWFVNFRYPGHENVPLVDSSLGAIPDGWEIRRIDEIADLHRGRSYRTVNLVDRGGVPFLNLKCIDRDGGFRRSGLKRYEGPIKPHQLAQTGDLVVAMTDMTQERRIVARVARVPRLGQPMAAMSMDLLRVAPTNPADTPFVYGLLRFSPFPDQVKQYANGANVLHLSPDRIAEYELAVPPKAIRYRFAEILNPMLELSDNLDLQNTTLRSTRDLLLPKLVAGEIDVSDLDIDAEWLAS